MQIVGEALIECLLVLRVDESVVEDTRSFMCKQLGAVITVNNDRLMGLHQTLDHLQNAQLHCNLFMSYSA